MEKLELKHLAPYLPYKLRVKYWDRNVVMNAGTGSSSNWIGITALLQRQNKIECLPILRPLSYIEHSIQDPVLGSIFPNKQIAKKLRDREPESFDSYTSAMNWVYIMVIDKLSEEKGYDDIPHWIFQDLIKWHFDVFGLIEKGLAISINTL